VARAGETEMRFLTATAGYRVADDNCSEDIREYSKEEACKQLLEHLERKAEARINISQRGSRWIVLILVTGSEDFNL
jgi:uncharacterized protein (UPF0128 family)